MALERRISASCRRQSPRRDQPSPPLRLAAGGGKIASPAPERAEALARRGIQPAASRPRIGAAIRIRPARHAARPSAHPCAAVASPSGQARRRRQTTAAPSRRRSPFGSARRPPPSSPADSIRPPSRRQRSGRTAQIERYIAQYKGGDCFFITPNTIATNTARIDGYGRDQAAFEILDDAFKQANGFEADIDVRQVTTPQCPALTFLARLRGERGNAPRLQIGETNLKSGQALIGSIEGVGNDNVQLLLVSDEGARAGLVGAAQAGRRRRGPSICACSASAHRARSRNCCVAVTSARPLETLKDAKSSGRPAVPACPGRGDTNRASRSARPFAISSSTGNAPCNRPRRMMPSTQPPMIASAIPGIRSARPIRVISPRSATLFGMKPTPLDSCRVLELGCGDGANLIPVAFQWPESEFVGLDLSEQAVRRGNELIARLGLKNIVLHACNIMDVSAQFGSFDYIIAHGVYSWVPDPVRREDALDPAREPDAARHRFRQLQLLSGLPFARYRAPDDALPRARRDRPAATRRPKPRPDEP